MRPCLALVPVLAALASSCGGGGGSIPDPASTYRQNQPGDQWNYSVSINFGIFGSYGGTLTEVLSPDTYNGQPTTMDTRTFNLQLQTGPGTITDYTETNAQGQLVAEDINGALEGVTSDTFNPPSQLALDQSASGVIAFSGGLTFTETYRVSGAEYINTPAGQFDCWVIQQTNMHSDGTSDSSTSYVAPEIGNAVKIVETTVNPDGSGYTYTATLTSTVAPVSANYPLRSIRLPSAPTLGSVPLPAR
jgi:hypothetical protein